MVIAYLRVGTSNKELLEEQKDEIERYASNHDMNVDKWITDVTVDKGREDERNLARVLDRMQKGDSLIFSDISRLGLNFCRKVMDIMGRCMEKGVQIYRYKRPVYPRSGIGFASYGKRVQVGDGDRTQFDVNPYQRGIEL